MPIHLRLLLLFAILLTPLEARGTALEGVVNDPQGSAIPGAAVTLRARGRALVYTRFTDSLGSFQFREILPGDYLLEVQAAEFAAAVLPVRVEAGHGDRLSIPLSLAAVSEQVTVTASGGAQAVREAARAVGVLDAAELGLRQKDSLAEALRETPGLRVQQVSGPGSFTKLVFRGLRTTNTSLLLDGLPIRDAAGFRGDLASFFAELNPVNVSALEVVRGAGSALYGSAATGGVINFVPREGAEGPHLDFGYEGGSLSQAMGRFSIAGGLGDKLGYSFGAARRDVNAGIDGNDVWRNTNLSGHLRHHLRPNMSWAANLYLSHTPRLDLNETPFPIGPPGNEFGFETGRGPVAGFLSNLDDPDDRRVSSIFPASVRFDHRLSNAYSYAVAWQAVLARRNFPTGPGQDPLAVRLGIAEFPAELSRFDGDDHLVQTRHTLQLGGLNLLTFGYAHEREARTQEFASGSFRTPPTTDRQSSHAVFFHNQLGLLDRRLQLGIAGRWQAFRVENPESVPDLEGLEAPTARTGDVSLSYFAPRTRTKLRAHAGNSFRAPSLSERFQVLTLSGQRVRIGNPLIEPERSLTVEGGVDQYLWNDRVQAGVTYYYNRLQSLITSTRLYQQTNVRGGISRGAEVEIRARPARHLTVRFAYSFTNAEFLPAFRVMRVDGTFAPGRVARRMEVIPEHTYSVSLAARRGRWDGFLDLTGISNYDAPLFSPIRFEQVLFRFHGYARANLGAGYTRALSDAWQMRWYGRVENALNKLYFEDGFRSPRAVGIIGVRFQFGG